MLAFFLLFAQLIAVFGYSGVDVSQATSESSFECLKSNGYHFACVRVYRSSGSCDPNGPTTINNAWKGGMSYVDGYIFPCYSCGNPAGQIDATINCLKSSGVNYSARNENGTAVSTSTGATYGMLWLDVEGPQSTYWSSSTTNNVNFLQAMVDELIAKKVNFGIYTSASQWNPIMGGSTKFSKYPLWYPHYDGSASFSDFTSFGGWTKPNIKQYAGTTSICSASVDKNWYP